MFKNYFKIAWRNLVKNKVSSLINIAGLAIGMAVATLIGIWIWDELSFNKYHRNYDRIVKVYRTDEVKGDKETSEVQTAGLGTLIKTLYSNYFESVAMVRGRVEERGLAVGEKKFTQEGYFVQPDMPQMLTLEMVSGTRNGLGEKYSILLSETLAEKLFGGIEPLNKIVSMDAKSNLKVTGVYKDLPKNTEFSQASYFAPLDLYLEDPAKLNAWDNQNMYIYALLRKDIDVDKATAAVKKAMWPHVDDKAGAVKPVLFLHPMKKWHLFSEFSNGVAIASEKLNFIWYYGLIGVFVLVLACINFMNLSTARSEKRAKEIGVRRVIGSRRGQLIHQFLTESVVIVTIAFLLSLSIVHLSLPWFNLVADKDALIPWQQPLFWCMCLCFAALTSLLAGSYPAFYLSSINPVYALKGGKLVSVKAFNLAVVSRKGLVIFQFAVSIVLIIGTAVVYRQIQFAKNRPVGYTPKALIFVRPGIPDYDQKFTVLRNELKKTGMVEEVGRSNYAITSTKGNNTGFEWQGKEGDFDPTFNTISVSHEYGKAVDWQFIEGRDFSRDYMNDASGVVINESALKLMELKNPIGEVLTWNRGEGKREQFTIVGVVRDVIKGSPYESVNPSINFLSETEMDWLYIRIKPDVSVNAALSKIADVYSRMLPSASFGYRFADEEYNAKFIAEERIGRLASVFATLAIFISCLGLFGLVSFTAEQRTKEIGVRKVLGASVIEVWKLLSKDFVVLVLIACVIAVPFAYYFSNHWLQNYQYHTEPSWWIFVVAGAAALMITLLTVSFQAIKAALANPVKSLRTE